MSSANIAWTDMAASVALWQFAIERGSIVQFRFGDLMQYLC